jgi:hypothetical protein
MGSSPCGGVAAREDGHGVQVDVGVEVPGMLDADLARIKRPDGGE